MKKLLLIIMVCASIKTQAQQTTFSKAFYDNLQYGIEEHGIARSFDNGYMIVGKQSFNNGYLLRLDSAGNFLLNKTYSPPPNSQLVFNSITAASDSFFVVAGSYYDWSNSSTNALCGKVDDNGNVLWMKSINISYGLTLVNVQSTNDGGFIMTGHASNNIAPYTLLLVAKMNASGGLEWMNILTGANNNNYGNSVKQAADSSYYITGYMENTFPTEYSTFLMNMSPAGAVVWTKKYYFFPSLFCSGNDLEITNNGIVCYINAANYDALMKTDMSGTVQWNYSYAFSTGSGGSYTAIPKLHQTADSGFVFISGGCFFDDVITKTNADGNLEWIDNLALIPVDVLETGNKELFVSGNGPLCGVRSQMVTSPQIGVIQMDSVGSTQSCNNTTSLSPTPNSIQNATILVTAFNGGTVNALVPVIGSPAITTYSGCVDVIGGIFENQLNNKLSISPNPVKEYVVVSYDSGVRSPGTTGVMKIIIYDIVGKEIYSGSFPLQYTQITIKIDVHQFESGIYFIKAGNSVQKFVKQ